MLLLFAKEVLELWLGSDFATESSVPLQILALGVLVSSLALIPYTLLQGIGRPDITAKFHLLELPIYLAIAWLLITHWGITGAATAWTLRVALDALLLFVAAFKICRFSLGMFAMNGLTLTISILFLLASATYGLKSLAGGLSIFTQTLVFVALFSSFTWIAWRNVLDASDRGVVLKLIRVWDGS